MDEKERAVYELPDTSGMDEHERVQKCQELLEFTLRHFGCSLQIVPQWVPAPGGVFQTMIGMNVVPNPPQGNTNG
jgi:hypothetical protein